MTGARVRTRRIASLTAPLLLVLWLPLATAASAATWSCTRNASQSQGGGVATLYKTKVSMVYDVCSQGNTFNYYLIHSIHYSASRSDSRILLGTVKAQAAIQGGASYEGSGALPNGHHNEGFCAVTGPKTIKQVTNATTTFAYAAHFPCKVGYWLFPRTEDTRICIILFDQPTRIGAGHLGSTNTSTCLAAF